jgi:hypothetical protein
MKFRTTRCSRLHVYSLWSRPVSRCATKMYKRSIIINRARMILGQQSVRGQEFFFLRKTRGARRLCNVRAALGHGRRWWPREPRVETRELGIMLVITNQRFTGSALERSCKTIVTLPSRPHGPHPVSYPTFSSFIYIIIFLTLRWWCRAAPTDLFKMAFSHGEKSKRSHPPFI